MRFCVIQQKKETDKDIRMALCRIGIRKRKKNPPRLLTLHGADDNILLYESKLNVRPVPLL
jgi:hypothetical protein